MSKEVKISVIKFEMVNGKKTYKSFTFKLNPKKMAKFKTEATVKKKVAEYVAKSGVYKPSEFQNLKYDMKEFLEEWQKMVPVVEAEELAKHLLDQLGVEALHAKLPIDAIDGDDHYAINYAGIGDAIEAMGGVIAKAGGTLRGEEMFSIQYDAQGLYSFSWQNRRRLIGCVNANVPLLPFEQVYQSFLSEARKQNLWKTTVEWIDGITYQGVDLTISEFSLAFTTVACGADNSLCYVIPIWRVFGRLQGTTPTGTRESTADEAGIATQSDSLLMMINAIDGTVLYADDGGASGR